MFIEIKNLKKSYTTGVVKTEVLKEIGMKPGCFSQKSGLLG